VRDLAKKMQRIRKRRFLFVSLRFCQPYGREAGWIVTGSPIEGPDVDLAGGPSLRRVLEEARLEANRLYDENGESVPRQDDPR